MMAAGAGLVGILSWKMKGRMIQVPHALIRGL